jgi:hypothetical protein
MTSLARDRLREGISAAVIRDDTSPYFGFARQLDLNASGGFLPESVLSGIEYELTNNKGKPLAITCSRVTAFCGDHATDSLWFKNGS